MVRGNQKREEREEGLRKTTPYRRGEEAKKVKKRCC